jgi:hypothetical protein
VNTLEATYHIVTPMFIGDAENILRRLSHLTRRYSISDNIHELASDHISQPSPSPKKPFPASASRV